MLNNKSREEWVVEPNADVRVECRGTWTRGMTLLDQRIRGQGPFDEKRMCSDDVEGAEDTSGGDYEGVDDDEGEWKGSKGNRVNVVWASSMSEGGNMKTVHKMAYLLWGLEPSDK